VESILDGRNGFPGFAELMTQRFSALLGEDDKAKAA
jgi:hypothetical protein